MSKSFLWGAATSAYQVEGGITNDFSDGGLDAGRACDHYNRFEKDFDLARSLDHNAYRFSIEWSRIEPEEGKFNQKEIDHYKKVIAALRERGLEPFVTLWHFTNPVWFARLGGWANKKAPDFFLRFAKKIVEELKDVKFWVTFNEPEIYANHAYFFGVWPPKKKNAPIARRVLRNFIKAHKLFYHWSKNTRQSIQIGWVTNLSGGPTRWFFNFPNHRSFAAVGSEIDFIGLNYYQRIRFFPGRNLPRSDMGWEIYPKGIYETINDLKKCNKPIYITENGIADASDKRRSDFIKDHIQWVEKAMEEGADVRGYFYWSLIDNFEWHHGFGPRFGLVEVDYKTLERKIRPSAQEYARIISHMVQ
ncbi:MAG: glycoside hydrolase family 1 protein [Candidatus Harrisonbacteria bacterium]|nr:glycoside hydrolase family 1 protein [Candidatus Harrisonbacteria bacterium]